MSEGLNKLDGFRGKVVKEVEIIPQRDQVKTGNGEELQFVDTSFNIQLVLHFTDGSFLRILSDSSPMENRFFARYPALRFSYKLHEGTPNDATIALELEIRRLYEQEQTRLKEHQANGEKIDVDPGPTAHAGAIWALDKIINFLASSGIQIWDAQQQIQQANEESMALEYKLSAAEKKVTQLEEDLRSERDRAEAFKKMYNDHGQRLLHQHQKLAEKDAEIVRLKALLFDKMEGK